MAYQIDQRSIRCWVKSKTQPALKLQCFLEFSPQLPLNQLSKSSGQENTQVTSKIISFTDGVKQQIQFVCLSHLLTFKRCLVLVSMPSNACLIICCCKLLQAWTIAARSALRVCWLRERSHICCFRYRHRKKSQTAMSRERGGHGESQRLAMTLPGN